MSMSRQLARTGVRHNLMLNKIRGNRKSVPEMMAEDQIPFPLRNEEILAEKVNVTDQNKKKLGVLSIEEARELAEEAGLDLVVTKNTKVPVCKIDDYDRICEDILESRRKRSEVLKGKLLSEEKPKVVKTKFIGFTNRTEKHDADRKIAQCLGFMEKGYQVKFEVQETKGPKGINKAAGQDEGVHITEYIAAELERNDAKVHFVRRSGVVSQLTVAPYSRADLKARQEALKVQLEMELAVKKSAGEKTNS